MIELSLQFIGGHERNERGGKKVWGCDGKIVSFQSVNIGSKGSLLISQKKKGGSKSLRGGREKTVERLSRGKGLEKGRDGHH